MSLWLARLAGCALAGLPWLALAALGLRDGPWWLALAPLWMAGLCLWCVLLCGLAARLWPGPPDGLYERGAAPAAFRAAARALLRTDLGQASARIFGLERVLASWPALFRLYLRALGARVGRATVARDVVLYLPNRLRLGDGAYIGSGSVCSALLELGPGRLRVGEIRLGPGAFVGADCRLAPGVSVGERSFVGVGSLLGADARLAADVVARGLLQLSPRAIVGPGCRLGYRVLLGRGAELGPRCRVGDAVVIGRGARIGPDAVLATGCVIAPGEVVAAGERR